MTPLDEALAAMEKAMQVALLTVRAEVREECARVVLKYDGPYEIVQAIREHDHFQTKNAIIEECARVADSFRNDWGGQDCETIAAAIRALKDKP